MSRTEQGKAEAGIRALFRQYGFNVESVNWVRARDGEFMAIVVPKLNFIGDLIEFITRSTLPQFPLEVQRIHTSTSAARVYLRWTTPAERAAEAKSGICSICGYIRPLPYETPADPPFYPELAGLRHCAGCAHWLETGELPEEG